jgi:hypothetical protein
LSALENGHDIIVSVENNFDASIKDEEVFDNRYLVYRCDRELGINNIGGGVAIAIKKSFQSERVKTAKNCEAVWVKITLKMP